MTTTFFPKRAHRSFCRRPSLPIAGLAVLFGLAALGVPARPSLAQHSLGKLLRISGSDPFATSTADHPALQPGTINAKSTVEPWVAVNPVNPLNIVAIFQQDRWTGPDGGSRGIVTAVSQDGGATWHRAVVPGIGLTSGSSFERDSDPWVAFAPNGDLYVNTLAFNVTTGGDAVFVNKSTDGGMTWSAPIDVGGGADKNSITADPFDAHYVYCVWDRGPIIFTRTTDTGATWESEREIYGGGTIGNQIVVEPNGTLYDFFFDYTSGSFANFLTSTDHGQTWSGPFIASDMRGAGVYDPVGNQTLRVHDELFPIAVDPATGNLYIVWGDSRFSSGQIDEIAFSQSTDGGATWSTPIKINKTPTSLPLGNRQAFYPTIAVASDGTIAVTYYDFRKIKTTSTALLTDDWVIFCKPSATNPPTNPASWSGELRLSVGSFDFHLAAYSNQGRMIGDYFGLQAIGNDFIAVFGKTSAYYLSAIFATRIYAN